VFSFVTGRITGGGPWDRALPIVLIGGLVSAAAFDLARAIFSSNGPHDFAAGRYVMSVFANLPAWVLGGLALLAMVVLILLNIGGLRSALALLGQLRRQSGTGKDQPEDSSEE
jgi:hypothetical protein